MVALGDQDQSPRNDLFTQESVLRIDNNQCGIVRVKFNGHLYSFRLVVLLNVIAGLPARELRGRLRFHFQLRFHKRHSEPLRFHVWRLPMA